jgi:hypothetical protein
MGTRIHVFLSHDLRPFDDASAMLTRLQVALPAALAVRDHWHLVDPPLPRRIKRQTLMKRGGHDLRSDNEIVAWEAEPMPRVAAPGSTALLARRYRGPGSLFLIVMPAGALIFTGARWRGFLSIEPLRCVHLAAFRAIAKALHSRDLLICHDRDDLAEDFLTNGNQQAAFERLWSALGPPQPTVDDIAPAVGAKAAHTVPDVWYVDSSGAAE